MDFINRSVDILYKWNNSSIARIEYFSYSIIGSMITLALLALISPLLDLQGSIWVVCSLSLLILSLVHNVYISIVLVSKRLRSMGYAVDHLWWIMGLWLVTSIHSWGEPDSTITYCLLGLDLIVSLWLLFTPGASGGKVDK